MHVAQKSARGPQVRAPCIVVLLKGRILLDYARFKRTMATKNSHFKVRGSVAHRDRNHTIGLMLPETTKAPFMTRVQGSQHQRHQRRALREQRQQIRQCTVGHKSPKGDFLYICARTQSPPSRPAPRPPCDLSLPDQWLLQALHGWKYGEQRQAPIASEIWAAAASPAIVVLACTPRVSARDADRGDGSRGLIA